MVSKQAEVFDAPQGHKGSPLPEVRENRAAKPTSFGKEFAFSVKLFGIAGLVVLVLWLLNEWV